MNEQAESLKQLCAEYLLIARFHLGNGARIHYIRSGADMSEKGLRQSRGMMVNYLYDTRYIERDHERFMTEGKIDCSSDVQKLEQKFKTAARKSA